MLLVVNASEEVHMMAALLSLGLLGAQPVSNRMPEVKVDALCRAMSADAKLMRLVETRTVAECVNDENDAKRQLSTVWGSTSESIRNRCQSDGIALGTRGYLDLLACIQIANDTKSVSTGAVSGASKKRRTK
jgi:hypothetical protein